jgi:hypothetical protein
VNGFIQTGGPLSGYFSEDALGGDWDCPVSAVAVCDEVGAGFVAAGEPTILPILGAWSGDFPAGATLGTVSDDPPPPYASHFFDRRFIVVR